MLQFCGKARTGGGRETEIHSKNSWARTGAGRGVVLILKHPQVKVLAVAGPFPADLGSLDPPEILQVSLALEIRVLGMFHREPGYLQLPNILQSWTSESCSGPGLIPQQTPQLIHTQDSPGSMMYPPLCAAAAGGQGQNPWPEGLPTVRGPDGLLALGGRLEKPEPPTGRKSLCPSVFSRLLSTNCALFQGRRCCLREGPYRPLGCP